MSALYNLEPQPTAKVLLTTTAGDLLLELFASQTPLASRNFLQHCLDGYYDSTIFHRLVPGFIIQGGDPTATGHGGDSIYPGGVFEDEFHSRLKFNRRGLLGMANGGGKNDNGSQFFLTLGDTRELEGRNTMFGRVVGDTIYNLMKMGDAELEGCEGNARPIYPTKIERSEVLVNPFEEMVRREPKARTQVSGGVTERQGVKKKGKKKGGKILLSFAGDESDEGAQESVLKTEKFNTKLISDDTDPRATKNVNKESKFTAKPTEKAAVKAVEKATTRTRSSHSRSPPSRTKPNPETQLPLPNNEALSRSPSDSPEPADVGRMSTLLDKTNAQIADLKASMKRNVPSAPAAEPRKKTAVEQMIPEASTRGRKRKHGINGDASADKQTMEILNAFRAKLDNAHPWTEASGIPAPDFDKQPSMNDDGEKQANHNDNDGNEAELCDLHFIANCQSCQSWNMRTSGDYDPREEDDQAWMSHALSFEKDRLGKDLTWKRKNEEELVVIDPRDKAKDIKEEQRAKKMPRIGGSTAWDRDRDKGRAPEKRAGERKHP